MLAPEDLDRIGPAVTAGTSVQGERRVASRGGVAADSRFRIASLTKVFTATALVLTLRDRGIALTTPAVELLPEHGHGHASVVLTNQEQALPAVAKVLSDGQRPLTGDDLTRAIDSFAA
jgi:CubicO group peptidase (beta-lactamase class C family)